MTVALISKCLPVFYLILQFSLCLASDEPAVITPYEVSARWKGFLALGIILTIILHALLQFSIKPSQRLTQEIRGGYAIVFLLVSAFSGFNFARGGPLVAVIFEMMSLGVPLLVPLIIGSFLAFFEFLPLPFLDIKYSSGSFKNIDNLEDALRILRQGIPTKKEDLVWAFVSFSTCLKSDTVVSAADKAQLQKLIKSVQVCAQNLVILNEPGDRDLFIQLKKANKTFPVAFAPDQEAVPKQVLNLSIDFEGQIKEYLKGPIALKPGMKLLSESYQQASKVTKDIKELAKRLDSEFLTLPTPIDSKISEKVIKDAQENLEGLRELDLFTFPSIIDLLDMDEDIDFCNFVKSKLKENALMAADFSVGERISEQKLFDLPALKNPQIPKDYDGKNTLELLNKIVAICPSGNLINFYKLADFNRDGPCGKLYSALKAHMTSFDAYLRTLLQTNFDPATKKPYASTYASCLTLLAIIGDNFNCNQSIQEFIGRLDPESAAAIICNSMESYLSTNFATLTFKEKVAAFASFYKIFKQFPNPTSQELKEVLARIKIGLEKIYAEFSTFVATFVKIPEQLPISKDLDKNEIDFTIKQQIDLAEIFLKNVKTFPPEVFFVAGGSEIPIFTKDVPSLKDAIERCAIAFMVADINNSMQELTKVLKSDDPLFIAAKLDAHKNHLKFSVPDTIKSIKEAYVKAYHAVIKHFNTKLDKLKPLTIDSKEKAEFLFHLSGKLHALTEDEVKIQEGSYNPVFPALQDCYKAVAAYFCEIYSKKYDGLSFTVENDSPHLLTLYNAVAEALSLLPTTFDLYSVIFEDIWEPARDFIYAIVRVNSKFADIVTEACFLDMTVPENKQHLVSLWNSFKNHQKLKAPMHPKLLGINKSLTVLETAVRELS